MEMVGPRGQGHRGQELRGRTRRNGALRVCDGGHGRRKSDGNEGRGCVLHRARTRQLGGGKRALCFAAFSRRGGVRQRKTEVSRPVWAAEPAKQLPSIVRRMGRERVPEMNRGVLKRGVLFREPVGVALETLRQHKMRSFLMLLGIILSVSTLIVVISLISGVNKYIADRVANLGSNVFLL